MESAGSKPMFVNAVAEIYQRQLVPLLFEPYAADLAARLSPLAPARVLEIAAGTGAVTRVLAKALPPASSIVATDLAPAMLAQAQAQATARPVEWRQADAQQLPFPDASFDAVVCQFGAMFFPDKPKAYAEARRVLKPGGVYLFNVWDDIEYSGFAATVRDALARLFPADPPKFMERTPHGYADAAAIRAHLIAGGFAPDRIRVETVVKKSRAASARDVAMAYCQGTPWRGEIEARDPARLGEATEAAAKSLAGRYGDGPVEAPMQALVILCYTAPHGP